MSRSFIIAAACAAALGGCATAADTAPPVTYTVTNANASIPFASNIRNFRVGKDVEKSLLLEGGNGRWYRATLERTCQSRLPWEHAIVIDNGAINTFDKFSALLIDGRRCHVTALDEIADPDTPKT